MSRKIPVPDVVWTALQVLGLEVGDYGRDFLWLTDGRKAFGVKLEGWGSECVPGKGREEAVREADALGRAWSREGMKAGIVRSDDDQVWAVTWGVVGPLKVSELAEEDLEEAVRID
jgi:hypothetical protein